MSTDAKGSRSDLSIWDNEENWTSMDGAGQAVGGEGGIRTHGTVARTPHFECGAFDHSATSPHFVKALAGRRRRGGRASSSAYARCLARLVERRTMLRLKPCRRSSVSLP